MIKYGIFGIISEIDKGRAKVYLEEDGIVTDWLPVLVRKSKTDKESWQLEINEHVICLMDEDFNEGVIIGAIPNDVDTPDPDEGAGKFRKKFSDGTEIEYDKNTGKLTVDVQGDLTGKATGKITLEAPAIEITGDITVNGSITATGDIQAGGKSLSTHVHGGVQPGGGTSGPPL